MSESKLYLVPDDTIKTLLIKDDVKLLKQFI